MLLLVAGIVSFGYGTPGIVLGVVCIVAGVGLKVWSGRLKSSPPTEDDANAQPC